MVVFPYLPLALRTEAGVCSPKCVRVVGLHRRAVWDVVELPRHANYLLVGDFFWVPTQSKQLPEYGFEILHSNHHTALPNFEIGEAI